MRTLGWTLLGLSTAMCVAAAALPWRERPGFDILGIAWLLMNARNLALVTLGTCLFAVGARVLLRDRTEA